MIINIIYNWFNLINNGIVIDYYQISLLFDLIMIIILIIIDNIIIINLIFSLE